MLFVLDIDEEWLDSLDAMADTALSSSNSTPEEAIEAIVFFQIKLQLVKKAGKQFVNRAIPPRPEMDFSWISSRQEAREEIQRRKNRLSIGVSKQEAEALKSEISSFF